MGEQMNRIKELESKLADKDHGATSVARASTGGSTKAQTGRLARMSTASTASRKDRYDITGNRRLSLASIAGPDQIRMRRTSAIALREGAGLRTGEDRDTVIKAQRDHMSANRHWLMQDLYGGGLLGAEDSGGYRKLKVVRESAPFEKMIDEAEADDKDPRSPKIPSPCRDRRSAGGASDQSANAKKKTIRQVPFREPADHPPTDGC